MLPYLMPLDNYIAPIEKKLTVQFNQPVHVGSLHVEIFPWPILQLGNVTAGERQELKVANVELTFDPLSLFSTVKNFRDVRLRDVTLEANSFEQELIWLQKIGLNDNYHYSHVTFQVVKILGMENSFPVFSGLVELADSGRIEKINLVSGDGKFDLNLKPTQSGWQLSLNAKGTTLPFFSNVAFEDLTANGEITPSGVNFADVDVQAFGGFFHGNTKLTWQHGWQLQGHLVANSVDLGKLFPKFGVAGELQGDANFTSSGTRLAQIADTTQFNGTFKVTKAIINTMDMVETIRRGGHQVGRTHLDVLTGVFQMNERAQHFQQLQLTSGMLKGRGSFDISTNGQLSGQISLELKAREGQSQLKLSGTLSEPVLRSDK